MNILMIDTATDSSIIAVRAGDKFAARHSHSRASHSGVLFAHIDEVLKETGIDIHDITVIGVGIGPGSFTGIRIAITTSRMMAQLLSCPLVGIHSQELYAAGMIADEAQAIHDGDLVLTAFDAKKGRLFAALYRAENRIPKTVLPAGDYFPAEIAAAAEGSRIVGCGSGSQLCEEAFTSKGLSLQTVEGFIPSAKAMSDLFIRIYEEDPSRYADFSKTLPYYARKSDAEILHLQKKALKEDLSNE